MAGRPTKFNNEIGKVMLALYEDGKTDAEVANIMGIAVRTIHYWKRKNPELLHSIKDAKKVADELVEAALYMRATGYYQPIEKTFFKNGKLVRVRLLKHFPPDPTCMIFWLKCRRPDRWS